MIEKYSLWFMPKDKVYTKYSNIIRNLAVKYNGLSFEPHITLICDIGDADAIVKTEKLANQISAFKINIIKASYMFDYYRCVLSLVEPSKEILNAAKLARTIFQDYNKREFIPHISLLYGNLDENTKKHIVSNLENISSEFIADRIYLVNAGKVPKDWKIIKVFNLGKV